MLAWASLKLMLFLGTHFPPGPNVESTHEHENSIIDGHSVTYRQIEGGPKLGQFPFTKTLRPARHLPQRVTW
jgi:hypothetical protein